MSDNGLNETNRRKSVFKANICHEQKTVSDRNAARKELTRRNCCSCFPSTISQLSTRRLLKHVRSKMAKGLHFMRRRSHKAPSICRSETYLNPVDSRRIEAIEDCIEFINSSSSLPRSNSVTANPP